MDPQPPVATSFARPRTKQEALSTHEFVPRVKRKFRFKKTPHHAHFMQGARTYNGSGDFYVLA